jgi:alkanesulfonate monooxygenase SsuD/methylene tetrahydromethanopterin reductase-like flavin-dependent oxidoreductase (luciferase family)
LRLGLWLTAQHPNGLPPAQAVRQHAEQVAVARELGFDLALAGQHFLPQPFWMLQTIPLLARISADAGGMRMGTGILLLTLLNPLEVAENLATLDAMAPGGIVAGVGLGYRDVENAAFGVGGGRSRLFEAKLGVVRRLLAGEEVTAVGPGFELDGARLALVPERPPAVWIAANSDAGVRRAARLGDAWLLNPHARLDQLERQVGIYRETRRALGLDAGVALPVAREVWVRPTDAQAVAAARPHLERKYASYVEWGQDEVMPAGDTLSGGWDELSAGGRFIVGSPETVVAAMREHERRLGAGELICRVQLPGTPHEEAMESLRLLGTEVLPAVA